MSLQRRKDSARAGTAFITPSLCPHLTTLLQAFYNTKEMKGALFSQCTKRCPLRPQNNATLQSGLPRPRRLLGEPVPLHDGKYSHTNVLVTTVKLDIYERCIKKQFREIFSQTGELLTTERHMCVAGAGRQGSRKSDSRNGDRSWGGRAEAWEGSRRGTLTW